MEIQVTKCRECPFHTENILREQLCTHWILKDYRRIWEPRKAGIVPMWCPLKKEEVTIVLRINREKEKA